MRWPRCQHSVQPNSRGGRSATRAPGRQRSSGRIYRPIVDPSERRRRRRSLGRRDQPDSIHTSAEAACNGTQTAPQWREVDITFTGPDAANPYTDVEAWVIFTHDSGRQLRRPVFWDGGTTYRVRFASTQPEGEWQWSVHTARPDHDFRPASGTLIAGPPVQDHPHRAVDSRVCEQHTRPAAASVTPTGRQRSGSSTQRGRCPSARQSTTSRRTRQTAKPKGFNAVFLMSVQPDMNARGPAGRNVDEGFEIGFHDLSEGRLTKINVEYFQYFDKIIDVLVNHGITPVLQPVFHGFGWKGLDVAGPVVPPADYARYCRYLVARFGARPAIYLPCGDGSGTEPQVAAGGREIQAWDAYGQATGIHYRPHHRNDEHQDADWLDFQSCQTGHMGDHVPDRLATMWAQRPPKAIMNGEPSYEHSGRHGVAEGWWQGHEAWSNVCAGALMGVAYGAASLWPWRLHPDEPGHGSYFLAEGAGWKEALDFEGSRYVGLVGKIVDDLPITEASPCWDVSANTRGLLDPGVLYLGYAEHGGPWMFFDADGRVPSKYWLIDPRTGEVLKSGDRPPNYVPIEFDRYEPSILICAETTPAWVNSRKRRRQLGGMHQYSPSLAG